MFPPEKIETVAQAMFDHACQPENSSAPPGTVTHAIREGEITPNEMAAVIRERLEKAAKDPS